MKKVLCLLLSLMLLCCGLFGAGAEKNEETSAPDMAQPTPSAAPEGEVFSSEDIIVTLPYGMEALSGDELKAYEAAVQDDFPDAARTLLAAANEDFSAVLVFSVVEGELSAADFAAEAAQIVLGDTEAISEESFGGKLYSAFTCAIGDQQYRIYALEGEAGLLVIGVSGMDKSEIETMLTGLNF